MNAPDTYDSDEGEGSKRVSSKLWPRLHHGSVHAAANKAGRRIYRCCHRGRGRHDRVSIVDPRTQPPSRPVTASTRARAGRACGCIRKEGGDVPGRVRRAALARIHGEATEGARER